MSKLVNFIKSMELRWSDLFLFVGFLFSSIYYAFAWLFMVTSDPSEIFLKDWMIIVSFIIIVICWTIYFILEYKAGNVPKNIFTILFVFYFVWSLISVLIAPSHMTMDVVMRTRNGMNEISYPDNVVNDIITVDINISATHKMFFSFATVILVTVFYIMYFVLPKRFKSCNFLILMAVATFIFLGIVILYGYITEYDHYIPFLKTLLGGGSMDEVYEHTVKSFMVQRVPYGVCMMLGLVFALLVHALTEKWQMYLLVVFFYINMFFSFTKTALIISALLVVAYLIFRLYKTYEEHKKRNKIIVIVSASLIGVFALLTAVSYISDGKFLPFFRTLVTSVTESTTIDSRSYIWDNTYQLLHNGYWILGRGFGTYNMMLYPMNLVNGDNVCPSHSTYNAVLGAGGIVSLFGYIALLFYSARLFIRCFKVDAQKTISVSFGAMAFILYSFTEGVNYLVCVFLFPLFVLHHVLFPEESK